MKIQLNDIVTNESGDSGVVVNIDSIDEGTIIVEWDNKSLENTVKLSELALDEKCDCEDKDDCDCEKHKEKKPEMSEESYDDEDEDDEEEEETKKKSKSMDEENLDTKKLASALGISENKVDKFSEMFHAAVSFKVDEAKDVLRQEIMEELQSEFKAKEESIIENLNVYCELTINEWIEENKPIIESKIESHKNQKIVEGLISILEENSIEISDEQIPVVEELTDQIDNLKLELQESEEKTSEYHKKLVVEAKKEEIRKYGLSESVNAKIYNIVESFEVDDRLSERIENVIELLTSSTNSVDESETVDENIESKIIRESFDEKLDEGFVKQHSIVKNKQPRTFDHFLSDLVQ